MVAEYAKNRGFSLRSLAERMGIDASSLYRYLSGAIRMPEERVQDMARHLELSDAQREHLLLTVEVMAGSDRLQDYLRRVEVRALIADSCDNKLDRIDQLVAALRESIIAIEQPLRPILAHREKDTDQWMKLADSDGPHDKG
jgi:transcriptional regulator with XRE-family HTH domain